MLNVLIITIALIMLIKYTVDSLEANEARGEAKYYSLEAAYWVPYFTYSTSKGIKVLTKFRY